MVQGISFESAFKGYNKGQVDDYMKRIEEMLAEKDKEIADLNEKLKITRRAYEAIKDDVGDVDHERKKIAAALLRAEEKADEIIKNVHDKAEKERRELEVSLERERENMVDIKKAVKSLRTEVVSMLQHFEVCLSALDDKIDA